MTHKLLVVTYPDDFTQFEMFCHCLNKNWQGSRNLVVVVQQSTDQQQQTVKATVDREFDHTWTVEIKNTLHNYGPGQGDSEQQVNKIFHSVDSGADDVIVFDSKDFVLRPCDFSTFKTADRYRVTYYLPGRLIDSYPDIAHVVDQSVDHLPNVSNLTPWIWNVAQLTGYWDHINTRFGHYSTWTRFPACTEIYGYYVFAWTEDARDVRWHKHPKHWPLLVGGGWTHQTYDGIVKEANDFDQSTERLVWKHSRKLEDLRCVDVTRSVLIKHGIDQQFVDQVYG